MADGAERPVAPRDRADRRRERDQEFLARGRLACLCGRDEAGLGDGVERTRPV
jgi:hypothetical protein